VKIAIDADQVFLDFFGTWKDFAEKVLGRNLKTLNDSYDLYYHYGLSLQEIFKVAVLFEDAGLWGEIRPIPEAIEVLEGLLDRGHEIHVITGIPSSFIAQREAQLKEIFPKHFNKRFFLHLSKNPYIWFSQAPSKELILKRLKPVFYCDDLWFHCEEAQKAGVPIIKRIRSVHDGGGKPVVGIEVCSDLPEAIAQLLDTNK